MALQTKGVSFENRKTLLSDIQEALPALTMQESELVSADLKAKIVGQVPEFYKKNHDEIMFYSNVTTRVGSRMDQTSVLA